jgi:hypothetical protein
LFRTLADSDTPQKKDLVLVHGATEDGNGVRVLRQREQTLEAGEMRPLEEGKPIRGEVVKLTRRPECPVLFDAETQFSTTTLAEPKKERKVATTYRSRSGPAQVASDSYRKNWDAVWKRRGKKPALLN